MRNSSNRPPIVANLGSAIRRRRLLVGLTLSSLAKKSGLSLGYVSQVELGTSSPSLYTLTRLCGVLEVTFTQLFSLAEVQEEIARIESAALSNAGT